MAKASKIIGGLLSGLGAGLTGFGKQKLEQKYLKDLSKANFQEKVSLLNLKEALRFRQAIEIIKLKHKLKMLGKSGSSSPNTKISLPVGIEM